jgi:hypothetical protein
MRPSTASAALPAALLVVACGSSVTTGSSGAGGSSTGTGGSGPGRTPMVHRATAAACPTSRPAGTQAPPQAADTCKTDADCTMGKNGRCNGTISTPNHCNYDECTTDADCGTVTACECRNPAAYGANTCVHGNCRVDADCGAGGFCSPSAVTLDPTCMFGIDIGSIGYFCHTSGDACVDHADCGTTAENACLFSVSAMHWACHVLMCTG